MSIAMLAGSIASIGLVKSNLRATDVAIGVSLGNQLGTVNSAMSAYVSANSTALISGAIITGVVSPKAPTILELKALGYLSANVNNTPTYGDAYNTLVSIAPDGCTTNCQAVGQVWLSSPVYRANNKPADVNLLGSAAQTSSTSQIGFSTPISPTLITGPGWTANNPDADKRVGILYATTQSIKPLTTGCSALSETNLIDCTHKSQLKTNSGGLNLTAIGINALAFNTSGNNNFAGGSDALKNNTSGRLNVAVGSGALYSNTDGLGNVANGNQALYSNTNGGYNVANGSTALKSNTTGYYNVANGFNALVNNTAGGQNVATGTNAMWSNINGAANSAHGYQSLYSNTTGGYNVANGRSALSANTTGSENVATGFNALFQNKTASYNVATGSYALYSNTIGTYNSASGYRALHSNITGSYNEGSGSNALYYIVAGNNNVGLGYKAGPATDLSNTISIGSNASATASNTARIGDSSMTLIGGQVAWSNLSDRRIKKEIRDSDRGLEFVRKLRPVDYILKDNNKPETGFIAQEVEAVDSTFPGINKPANDKAFYSLAYTDFIPSLVKSVQELDQKMESNKSSLASHSDATAVNYLIGALAVLFAWNCYLQFSVSRLKRRVAANDEQYKKLA